MKIMLDECLCKGPAESIKQYIALEDEFVQVSFLLDYLKAAGISGEAIAKGVKDASWADRIKAEGGWCVISADRGKHTKQIDGPPLPTILKTRGVTAAFIGGSTHMDNVAEKARAVISVWPELKRRFRDCAAGTRIRIRRAPSGHFTLEVCA